jgi:predicted small lipoprotein YifL
MRVIVAAILLCVLLEACGSKGALTMPPTPDGERQQQSDSNKQN